MDGPSGYNSLTHATVRSSVRNGVVVYGVCLQRTCQRIIRRQIPSSRLVRCGEYDMCCLCVPLQYSLLLLYIIISSLFF